MRSLGQLQVSVTTASACAAQFISGEFFIVVLAALRRVIGVRHAAVAIRVFVLGIVSVMAFTVHLLIFAVIFWPVAAHLLDPRFDLGRVRFAM